MHYDSWSETSDDNARFSRHLFDWLVARDVDTRHARGVVMLVLLDHGFDVLQLGPQALSDDELAATVGAIADHLRLDQATKN